MIKLSAPISGSVITTGLTATFTSSTTWERNLRVSPRRTSSKFVRHASRSSIPTRFRPASGSPLHRPNGLRRTSHGPNKGEGSTICASVRLVHADLSVLLALLEHGNEESSQFGD